MNRPTARNRRRAAARREGFAPAVGALTMIALVMVAPMAAHAIWVQDNSRPFNAQANLNMRLDVGKFLYLQVGTPGAVIDTVQFNLGSVVSGSNVVTTLSAPLWGTGGAVPASSAGTLQVVVRGNSGPISLTATNNGGGLGLANGAGGFLNYNQILTSSDNAALPAPVLSNAGGSTVTITANAYGGLVTDQVANWTFTFANTMVPAAGNYSGQVTFTAAMP